MLEKRFFVKKTMNFFHPDQAGEWRTNNWIYIENWRR